MICCRGVALFKADVMAILLGRQYLHASPQSGSDLPFPPSAASLCSRVDKMLPGIDRRKLHRPSSASANHDQLSFLWPMPPVAL